MSLLEFAKMLGIKRGIAEDALHSERVARLVLSRRTMLIGMAAATAALCNGSRTIQGSLEVPVLHIPAKETRIIEGVHLFVGDSVDMSADLLYPDGSRCPDYVRWQLLKDYQAKYGGYFIEPRKSPAPLTNVERHQFKQLMDECEHHDVIELFPPSVDEDDEPCMNCALPGYESPFDPDREDCTVCHGTGRCPASVNDNPPKQYKTAKRES